MFQKAFPKGTRVSVAVRDDGTVLVRADVLRKQPDWLQRRPEITDAEVEALVLGKVQQASERGSPLSNQEARNRHVAVFDDLISRVQYDEAIRRLIQAGKVRLSGSTGGRGVKTLILPVGK